MRKREQLVWSLGCLAILTVACNNSAARKDIIRLDRQLSDRSTRHSIRAALPTYPSLKMHEVEANKWAVATRSTLFEQNWVLWLSFSGACLQRVDVRILDNAGWRPEGAPEDREFASAGQACSEVGLM
jgi:hypothetical protein